MKTSKFNFHSLNLRRYIGLGAAAFALAVLPACSDDEPANGGEGTPDVPGQIQGEAVNIVDNPDILSTRVRNFDLSNGLSRAGGAEAFKMPAAPVEADYADAVESDGNNLQNNTKYIIKDSDKELWLGMNGGVIVYIAGANVKLNTSYSNGDNTIIVLPTASVTLGGWNGGNLYVYGAVSVAGNISMNSGSINLAGGVDAPDYELYIGNNSKFNAEGDLTFKKVQVQDGQLAAESVIAEKIVMQNNVKVNIVGSIEATGEDVSEWDAAFQVNAQGELYARCVVVPNGTLKVANCGKFFVDKFIGAKNMNVDASGAKINMGAKAVVDIANRLFMPNHNTGFYFSASAADMGLIKAAVFAGQDQPNNGKEGTPREIECGGLFSGNVYLDFVKTVSKDDANRECGMMNRQSGVWTKDDPEAKYPYIPTDNEGCHGQYGTPVDPVQPEDFDVVGTTDIHKHPISATCIDVYGNQAFLSWHKRGIGSTNLPAGSNTNHPHDGISYWGCIEVLTVQADTLAITSYMETKPETDGGAYDFNHVIYDPQNNALLTTGDHDKKGGVIGKIQLGPDHNFGKYTNETSIMQVRHLLKGEGVSGNSVVIRPSDRTLLITAAGGYQTMDYSTNKLFDSNKKEVGPFVKTAGSAKHVAINNDYAATIEFTQRPGDLGVEYDEDDNTTVLPAKITVWPIAGFMTDAVKEIEVPAFGPVYGKNVIAIDTDNVIYSCQGHNGVAAYDINGNELRRWDIPKMYKGAAANGLCIKDGNLYIAAGAAGVWVVDKNDFTNVKAKYTKQGNASANYVKVADNGYVFVAYGRSGAKLLKPRKAL